jgi:brefeldin A-inhibited guanine nucleotide-exchange protein
MNIISKIGTLPFTAAQNKVSEPTSPALNPSKDRHHTVPPSLSTYSLSVSGSMDTTTMGLSEQQLKRQGLECLAAVLRSLVTWGTSSTGKSAADASLRSQGEDIRQEIVTPDASVDRVSLSANSVEALRQPTPDVVDDPSRFESAKQKKTTLLEGIKNFNYKPKRVGGPHNIH